MAVAISVPPVPNFDVHGDITTVHHRWQKWVRCFETFSVAAGCTHDAQKRQYSCFYTVRDIFETLPDTGNTYDEVKVKLENYFKPKANVPYNRHVFRQSEQNSEESVAQFVTKLRKLAIGCSFDSADDFIRDQVIEKCTSNLLRKKLLAETDLKLEKVLDVAQALETSEFQASKINGRARDSVCAIKIQNKTDRRAFSRPRTG